MFGQSQDDINLNSRKQKHEAKERSLSRKELNKSPDYRWKLGSMPALNSHEFLGHKLCGVRECKLQDHVVFCPIQQEQSDLEADELCSIADEIHSKISSKIPLIGSAVLNENKQYHSWPKQHGKRRNTPSTVSYHNFGLSPDIAKERHRIQISKVDEENTASFDVKPGNGVLSFDNLNTLKKEKVLSKAAISCSKKAESEFVYERASPLPNDITDTFSSDSFDDSDDWDSGLGQFNDFHPLLYASNGIAPPLFKKRKDLILQWFKDFSDEQKNIFIQNIMDTCGLPQMHMLSLKMEPRLHKDCPQNCRDMIQWLPENPALHIFSYLDYKSLSKACQVNRVWHSYASQDTLWQRFCRYPDYRLSAVRHHEQLLKYRSATGRTQIFFCEAFENRIDILPEKWRSIFVERYLCRRNWTKGKCRVKTLFGHTAGVSCIQFDNKRIVSGSSDKTIRVWDLTSTSSEPVLTLVGHSGTVRCLQLSGNRVISGSADATIKVWDLSVGQDWNMAACRVTMVGHSDTVRCLQVDEQKVISGSYDMTIKVWELKTGRCKLSLRGHVAAVLCVQFDEEKIVSGSADNTIKVWGITDGVCLATLRGHHNAVTCLQFNHTKIISGSLDCTLKFWDLNSGQCIGTIDWIRSEGHTRVVRCLQADNWKIVSAGDDKTLKIWSLKTGERLVTLHKHTDGVTCLQFDDVMIVSGSYDKTVKVWNFLP